MSNSIYPDLSNSKSDVRYAQAKALTSDLQGFGNNTVHPRGDITFEETSEEYIRNQFAGAQTADFWITGQGRLNTINNATTDTDKILVSDGGVIKYRTGAEILGDIGAEVLLTFNNGLTRTVNTIGLGGTLTANTNINPGAYIFAIGDHGITNSNYTSIGNNFIESIYNNGVFSSDWGINAGLSYFDIRDATHRADIQFNPNFVNLQSSNLAFTTISAIEIYSTEIRIKPKDGLLKLYDITNDDTETKLLTWNSTDRKVEYRTASSLSTALSTAFIQNQFAAAQTSSSFWIDGRMRTDSINAVAVQFTGINPFNPGFIFNGSTSHTSLYTFSSQNMSTLPGRTQFTSYFVQFQSTAYIEAFQQSLKVLIRYPALAGKGLWIDDAGEGGIVGYKPFRIDVTGVEKAYVTNDGSLWLNSIPNATIDTDKFLVSDSGVIKYRTGTELISDLGLTGSFIQNQFAAAQTSASFWIDGNARIDGELRINTTDLGTFKLQVAGESILTSTLYAAYSSGAVVFGSTANTGQLTTAYRQSTNSGIGFLIGYESFASNNVYLYNGEAGSITLFNNSGTRYLQLSSAGTVGISTTVTTAALNIQASITSVYGIQILNSSYYGNVLRFDLGAEAGMLIWGNSARSSLFTTTNGYHGGLQLTGEGFFIRHNTYPFTNALTVNATNPTTSPATFTFRGINPISYGAAYITDHKLIHSWVYDEFDTTAATRISYAGYFQNNANRLTGSNALTNVGIYATATGGQNNYAAIFDAGNVGIGITAPTSKFHTVGSTHLDVTGTTLKWTLGSDATGDIYYRDGSGNIVRLAAGTNGHYLKLVAGLPAWAAVSGSGDTNFAADDLTLTANRTHEFATFSMTFQNGGPLNIKMTTNARDIIPEADETYDLGADGTHWDNLYTAAIRFRVSTAPTDYWKMDVQDEEFYIANNAGTNVLMMALSSGLWLHKTGAAYVMLDTQSLTAGRVLTIPDVTGTIAVQSFYQMSVTSDASGFKLVGDSATPGNSKVYGTNGAGTKGWYDAAVDTNFATTNLTLTGNRSHNTADYSMLIRTTTTTVGWGDAYLTIKPCIDDNSDFGWELKTVNASGNNTWVQGLDSGIYMVADNATLQSSFWVNIDRILMYPNAGNLEIFDLVNDTNQNQLLGRRSSNSRVGYITLDDGLAITAGVLSPVVQMSITTDASGFKLTNDEATPTDGKFYGKVGGAKGWFTPPSGGSAVITQTEVDFGTTPVYSGTFTISDAGVGAGALVMATLAYDAPTGRTLDEVEDVDLQISAGNCGTGTFELYIKSTNGTSLAGKYKINYIIYYVP